MLPTILLNSFSTKVKGFAGFSWFRILYGQYYAIVILLSRLHSGACDVPYPPVIQRHGVGSSESVRARLQSPELPPCDLNQERSAGRLLHTLRLSPEKLACCHGNRCLPVGGGQFCDRHGISGAHKESEHSGHHYRHHRPDGELLPRVSLMLSRLPQYLSRCKSLFTCSVFVVSSWVLNRWRRCSLKPPSGCWTGCLL